MYEDCCRCCTDICMSTYDDRGVLLLCHSHHPAHFTSYDHMLDVSQLLLVATRYQVSFVFCFLLLFLTRGHLLMYEDCCRCCTDICMSIYDEYCCCCCCCCCCCWCFCLWAACGLVIILFAIVLVLCAHADISSPRTSVGALHHQATPWRGSGHPPPSDPPSTRHRASDLTKFVR